MASYASVTWTGGDTITESKLDNMVNNDRAEDAHESGVDLLNDSALRGKDVGGTLQNLIKVNSSDNVELGDSDLDKLRIINTRQEPEYDNGNSGTSKTINFENGSNQKITATDDCTLSFSNVEAGDTVNLQIVMDGSGGHTFTFPAGTKAPNGNINIADGADEITWIAIKAVSASEYHVVAVVRDLESV